MDAFQVDFRIDGASIGSKSVSPVIASGASVYVTQTWEAQPGNHTIEVVADSTNTVLESYEENNSLSQALPEILDSTPPELVSTNPTDGSVVQQVSQIVITLFDQWGTVDDDAVIGSISVTLSGQGVSGTVSENSDVFTFTPGTTPLADGAYQVSFTAADVAGNTESHTFSFTVDSQPPAKPVITGGTILSGTIQARPFAGNRSNSASITLTGTRDDETSVWINSALKVQEGTSDWSVVLTLSQGDNALEVWVQDQAGNKSESEWVDILVDSVAPAITSVTPADGSFLNASPANVTIGFQEATSGLNLDNTTRSVKDGSQAEVTGTWTVPGGNHLVFTPSGTFDDSTYTIDLQLEDNLGNRGPAAQYHFTVDTAPPPVPVINPVTSPTHNPTQVITGTKEAYASILLAGQEIVGNTAGTTWQHTVTLQSGSNQFVFAAKDRAGNQSGDVTVEIVYDDIPPLAVDTLTANGQGDGMTVVLDWTGYDESLHGDIASYRIYYETSSFTDVTTHTIRGTVPAGAFTYTVLNLTKGTTYWFAVVAVDVMGNALNTVTPVTCVPTDIVPPEDVTNLNVQSFENKLIF